VIDVEYDVSESLCEREGGRERERERGREREVSKL
jgi:hypothetical protein